MSNSSELQFPPCKDRNKALLSFNILDLSSQEYVDANESISLPTQLTIAQLFLLQGKNDKVVKTAKLNITCTLNLAVT